MMVLNSLVPDIKGYQVKLEQRSNQISYNLYLKHLHSGVIVSRRFTLPFDSYNVFRPDKAKKILWTVIEDLLEEITNSSNIRK